MMVQERNIPLALVRWQRTIFFLLDWEGTNLAVGAWDQV